MQLRNSEFLVSILAVLQPRIHTMLLAGTSEARPGLGIHSRTCDDAHAVQVGRPTPSRGMLAKHLQAANKLTLPAPETRDLQNGELTLTLPSHGLG